MNYKFSFAIIMSSASAQITYGIQAGAYFAYCKGDALQSLNNAVDLPGGFISKKNRTGLMIDGYPDIPPALKAGVTKGSNIYAGPQVSYLIKSTLQVNTGIPGVSSVNKRVNLTDNFNPPDPGLTEGISCAFDNGLNIKAVYDYGLAKLDKNDNFKPATGQ